MKTNKATVERVTRQLEAIITHDKNQTKLSAFAEDAIALIQALNELKPCNEKTRV